MRRSLALALTPSRLVATDQDVCWTSEPVDLLATGSSHCIRKSGIGSAECKAWDATAGYMQREVISEFTGQGDSGYPPNYWLPLTGCMIPRYADWWAMSRIASSHPRKGMHGVAWYVQRKVNNVSHPIYRDTAIEPMMDDHQPWCTRYTGSPFHANSARLPTRLRCARARGIFTGGLPQAKRSRVDGIRASRAMPMLRHVQNSLYGLFEQQA